MPRRLLLAIAIAAVALAATAGSAVADPNNNNSSKLRKAVTVAGITEHLAALQGIADANGGTRASGTPGYTASVNYVVQKATAAGYSVSVQDFPFAYFAETAPPVLNRTLPPPQVFYTPGPDFSTMTYSGSGNVTRFVQAVDTPATPNAASTSGCEAADFAGFIAGRIALLQRGTCPFFDKATNAQASGAAGVIIFNRGTGTDTGVINGTLGAPGVTIPVVGASFAVGQALYTADASVEARLATSTISEFRVTQNVFAETRNGNPSNVVMVGAHLDSVEEGPGINDNGSGSATILEIAEQMSKVKPHNKVRFAWWGAEEFNLLGSIHYVDNLPDEELAKLALYLNFDMVASPNFGRFVYDGDGSGFGTPGPTGSAAIEQVFNQYFDAQGLAYLPTAFDGRSDYGPFIEVGVPSGGLFTGAEDIKSPAEVPLFGGTAGVAYDVCYHQACDTIANVNPTGLDQMSDAAAHTVITFAQNTSLMNGVKGKGNFKSFDQLGRQAAK